MVISVNKRMTKMVTELTCDQDDALRKGIKRCVNKILIFAPSLNISKNLPKIKAKEVGHVMEAIVNLIQVTSLSHQVAKSFYIFCERIMVVLFSGGGVFLAKAELVRLQTQD